MRPGRTLTASAKQCRSDEGEVVPVPHVATLAEAVGNTMAAIIACQLHASATNRVTASIALLLMYVGVGVRKLFPAFHK